jgi:tetratricopeptide (TPR) repeat protein
MCNPAQPHRPLASSFPLKLSHLRRAASTRSWCALGVAAVALLCAGNSFAASSYQKACEDNSTVPDARLASCAKWLQTDRLTAFGKYVAYQNRAFAFEKKDQIDDAIAEWTKAISSDPTQSDGYYNRGNAWANKKNYNSAIADYNRAIEIDPKWLRYFIMRGNAYGNKNDHESAIADYSEAIRINPKDDSGYFNRALQWVQEKKFDKAAADFDKAIELDPKDAKYRYFRALSKVQSGDLDGSIEDFTEASRLAPKAWEPYNDRGLVYLKKGDLEHALADFSSSIEIQPKAIAPRNNRGRVFLEKGNVDKALGEFDEAIRIAPSNALGLSFRCFVHTKKREYDSAIKDCEAAIAAIPDFPLAYAYRGLAFEAEGEIERAKADYEKAVSGNTAYDTAENARSLASKQLASLTSPTSPGSSVRPQGPSNDPPKASIATSLDTSTLVGRRVALVIGNSAYANVTRLENPANDARLMADTLRGLGFRLVGGGAQLDLNKAALDRLVQQFGTESLGADVGLFYYAGHGVQVRGSNYLVPVDANPTREGDVDFQMLDANMVLRQMTDANTKLNLVLLDACRNNPFGGRGLRAATGGLAQMRAPEGTLISFATQPGNIALDGVDGDSPYTKAVAEVIRKPKLDVFRTFNEVGLAVAKATGGQQQPWLAMSPISGDFYFAGGQVNGQE